MNVSRLVLGVSRRALIGTLALAVIAGPLAGAALAQTPPAAPQAPPAQADPMTFSADRMLVLFLIAEGGAADFEDIMSKAKDTLAKSSKAERKEQAAHWKLLRAEQPQNGIVTFFFYIDQVAKGQSYDPFKVLAEETPPDKVLELYNKFTPNLKGISTVPLGKIVDMGGGA